MLSWKRAAAFNKLTLSKTDWFSRLINYENRQRECPPGYVATSSLRKLGRPRGPPVSTNGFHPQAFSPRDSLRFPLTAEPPLNTFPAVADILDRLLHSAA